MLSRYLTLTFGRKIEKLGWSGFWLGVIVLIIGLIVGSIFWILGLAGINQIYLLGIFVFLAFAYGTWLGLRYIDTHRPTGLGFINKDGWLWLGLAKGIGLGLLLATITVVPYYGSIYYYYGSGSIWIDKIFVLIVYTAFLSVSLVSTLIALIVRRASKNALVRLTILILVAFTVSMVILTKYSFFSRIEIDLFLAPSTNIFLPFILLLTSVCAIAVTGIELIFNATALTSNESRKFWNAAGHLRLFKYVKSPFVASIILNWLYYLRSAYFQRRILAILVAFLFYPFVADFLLLNEGKVLVGGLVVFTWLITFVLAVTAGRAAEGELQYFKKLPQSKKIRPLSNIFASAILLLVLITIFLGLIGKSISWPQAIFVAIFALGAHLVFFYTGLNAESLALTKNVNPHDSSRMLILGSLISLVLVIVALAFYGTVSLFATELIIALWAAAGCFLMLRVNYYIRARS